MRLGRLILQLCALAIAAALVVGGYILYEQRKVAQYRKNVLQGLHIADAQGLVGVLRNAPAMVCTESYSDFESASRVTSYHHEGNSRIDFVSLTRREVQHWVIRNNDLYIWADGSDAILHLDAGPNSQPFEFAGVFPPLFVSAQCAVWWRPDDRVFDIPASKPIIESNS